LPLPQLLHHQLQLWRFRLVLLAQAVQVVLLAQVVQVVLLAQVGVAQVGVVQVAVMEQVLADIRPLLKSQIA
jgi:hypothetical protein